MPDRCSIPECRAISNRINGRLSMFRLPRDASLRAKWLKSMGKKDWTPGDKAVICERHFEPSCIEKLGPEGAVDKSGRRMKSKITLGSYPTILVPAGTSALPVQERTRKRKRGRTRKAMEGKRRRGRRKKTEDLDSMPLQQRLTAISTTNTAQEQEKAVPTLKSQPLSPTKLKVTRQSTRPLQQLLPKPIEEPPKPVKEEVCLKWNTHHSNLQTAFPALLDKEQYCDVTLVAEGKSLKCHKLILSSCSTYFDEVLVNVTPYQHPIIFMKDIPFKILKALCDFMYTGEVNIEQSDLDVILAVGESLKIKGLISKSDASNASNSKTTTEPQKVPVKSTRAAGKPVASEKKDPKEDVDITDPLDLMEPTYEEEATPEIRPSAFRRNDSARKSTGRRVRKRKHVEEEHEPSPPVFRLRKGTRSRPNVKVPRYFNANFDNSIPPPTPEPTEFIQSIEAEDPYLNILEQIKTEPLDIEEGFITFEEETYNHEMPSVEPETGHFDPGPEVQDTPEVVKKRRTFKSTEPQKLDPLNIIDHNLDRSERREESVQDCESIERLEESREIERPLEGLVDNCIAEDNTDTHEIEVEINEKEKSMEDNREYTNFVEEQQENTNSTNIDERNDSNEIRNENGSQEIQDESNLHEIAQEITRLESSENAEQDFPEIRIENSFTDAIEGEECEDVEMPIINEDSEMQEENTDKNNEESNQLEEKELADNNQMLENSIEEIERNENMTNERSSEDELNLENARESDKDQNSSINKENPSDEVSPDSAVQEGCNSSEAVNTTVEDPPESRSED